MLTVDRLKEVLAYDPTSGEFRWRVPRKHCSVGAIVGRVGIHGYRRIGIDGVRYRAGRLAWFYMTGEWAPADIDHINGEKADDRWVNLRSATRSQNLANCKKRKDNTTGFKGVTFSKEMRKFQAQIHYQRKTRLLGFFDTPEQAHVAYCQAATHLFGEYARAG